MGLSCGMNFLKILMFIFNFIFWLLGIAVLGVGIWSRVDGGTWKDLVADSTIPNAANLMIASGVFVALIGFLGCCGAIKKHRCMLISYAILIFMIFILELAAGIYAYTKKGDVQKHLETNLKKTVSQSYGGKSASDQGLTRAVNWFQTNLKCCGAAKPADWTNSSWFKGLTVKTQTVPDTCCRKTGQCKTGSIANLKKNNKIWTNGCVKEGKKFVQKNLYKIGGAAIGIGVIQLLGIIFACCLCNAIKEEEIGSHA